MFELLLCITTVASRNPHQRPLAASPAPAFFTVHAPSFCLFFCRPFLSYFCPLSLHFREITASYLIILVIVPCTMSAAVRTTVLFRASVAAACSPPRIPACRCRDFVPAVCHCFAHHLGPSHTSWALWRFLYFPFLFLYFVLFVPLVLLVCPPPLPTTLVLCVSTRADDRQTGVRVLCTNPAP